MEFNLKQHNIKLWLVANYASWVCFSVKRKETPSSIKFSKDNSYLGYHVINKVEKISFLYPFIKENLVTP